MRERLKNELGKMISAEKWEMIRTWFSIWDSEEEMIHKCHLWGFMFMPDYFRAKGAPAHLDLIRGNLNNLNEYAAFPRGFAKTTINQLCISFECANGTQKFIPIIEKTWNEASEVLNGVRDIFSRELTKVIYGNLIGHTVEGKEAERQPDAKGDVFINGVRLRALGFNKTIRGLKDKAWRPTKIYVDDVEEDEHIGNPDQRTKYLQNYLRGIMPSLDINGSIKVRGTILHYDSLLFNLIEQHKGLIYKAYDKFDPTNTLLWPEYWTLEKLQAKRKEMEADGKGINAFYQEYLNEPISEEERDFKWEWITKTYKDEDLKYKNFNLYACLDVANATGEGNDSTGVVVEAIDENGYWYNKLTKNYKVDILGLIDLIFELWAMPGMRVIGVEKQAFEDQIKPLLDKESEIRGKYPTVVELKHGGKRKYDRIKGSLQGLYKLGKILNKESAEDDTRILWDQLYSMGGGTISAKHDDLADAKAYITQIAESPITEEFRERYRKIGQRRGRTDPLSNIRKKYE